MALATGCGRRAPSGDTAGSAEDFGLDLSLADQVWTVATARFTVDADAAATRVEFGEGDAFDRSVDAGSGAGEHEVRLFGLPPGAEVQARVVVETDAGEEVGAPVAVDVPPAPSELPSLEVTGELPLDGAILTTFVSDPSVPVILDGRGRARWWSLASGGEEAIVSRAVLSQDGESALFLEFPTTTENPFEVYDLVRVALDGSSEERTGIVSPHHDFVELPDGTVAVIVFDAREKGGENVLGDAIVEVDPDGTVAQVWSVWDEVDYDPGSGEDGLSGTGWSHCNAIDYDAEADAYWISVSGFGAVWKVDRATGEVVEHFGGALGDWTDEDGGTDLLRRTHQFDFEGDRLLVFDNGSTDDLASEVVEFELDRSTMTARRVWTYSLDPVQFVGALGDASYLPDGNRLVVWSTLGIVEVVSPEGEVLWRATTDVGSGIGYATWLESLDEG